MSPQAAEDLVDVCEALHSSAIASMSEADSISRRYFLTRGAGAEDEPAECPAEPAGAEEPVGPAEPAGAEERDGRMSHAWSAPAEFVVVDSTVSGIELRRGRVLWGGKRCQHRSRVSSRAEAHPRRTSTYGPHG